MLVAALVTAVAAAATTVAIVSSRPPIEARPLAPSNYRSVGNDAIEQLADAGTRVEIVPTHESPEKAILVASNAFGQTVGKEPQEVSLAIVTVSHYGTDSDDAPGTEGLKLKIHDRLVWLVIFEDFKNYAFGPAPTKLSDQGETARYEVTRLVVYVDQATNEFLLADTIA